MAKHFYELTLEVTECHPQSSTVYLGSPTWGPRKQMQTPALEWRNVKSHDERTASEMGGRAIDVFGKKKKNLPCRPLRMIPALSLDDGVPLTPHWPLLTRFLQTRKLIHPAHPHPPSMAQWGHHLLPGSLPSCLA